MHHYKSDVDIRYFNCHHIKCDILRLTMATYFCNNPPPPICELPDYTDNYNMLM